MYRIYIDQEIAMKICMLTSTYPRFSNDGSGRFIKSMAEAIARHGHEVYVVVPYYPHSHYDSESVRVIPFRYIWPNRLAIMGYGQALYNDQKLRKKAYFLAPFFSISSLFTLLRAHYKYNFDVLHAHWVIPNGPIAMLFSRLTSIPFIVSLHGSDIFIALKNRILGFISRICFDHSAAITACSQQLHDGALSLGALKSKLSVIPWGADPAIFDPLRFPPQNVLREQLGWPKDVHVILTICRLVKKKGVEYLIKSAYLLKNKIPNILVVIAGDGPERKALEQLTESLNASSYVRFIGRVDWDSVATLLHASDIFVAPSVEDETGNIDGLPTAILEAMAAGKLVVASNIGGIPLVISHERTGLLVPQRDEHALAQALAYALTNDNLRRRIGSHARQNVINYLNWDRVAMDFINIYRKAAQKQGVKYYV